VSVPQDDAAMQIKNAGMVNVCQYLGPPVRPVIAPRPAPAPSPPAPPVNAVPHITMTCVFNVGGVEASWFDGVSYAFFDGAGHGNRQYINREVDFSPASFKDCRGLLGGAVPLGTTRILVRSAALCTNLISGHQTTLINMLCPREKSE
jgi:hypothetical protein